MFRGSSEGKIREGLLKNDLIEAIVGLPEKLFYNTGIPASIIILNKSKAKGLKNKVIFVDASKEYQAGKNQNSLSAENIEKIVSAYDALVSIDKFMRLVDLDEIKENDYNLNIARYIDTSEPEKIIDIAATLAKIAEIESKEKEIDVRLNGFLRELGFVL